MIPYLFIKVFLVVISAILLFIPSVTVLPFGIDAPLLAFSGWLNGIFTAFWPFQLPWTLFIWFLNLAVLLLGLKLILGSRTPHNG